MSKNPEAKLESIATGDPVIDGTRSSVRERFMNIATGTGERLGTAVSVGAELLGIGAGAVIKTAGKATVAAAKGVLQGLRGPTAKNISQAI